VDVRNTISFNNFQDEFQVIQYIGLKTPDKAFLWVRDRKNNFSDVKNGYIPAKISGQTIKITLNNGYYRISFYNTYNGQIIKTDYQDCSGGILEVDLPDFIKDIAVKIE
jgi:hypothetical protein